MITEKHLHDNPALIKAFTGLVEDAFWQLISDLPVLARESQNAGI
jgi:hypothetical protein